MSQQCVLPRASALYWQLNHAGIAWFDAIRHCHPQHADRGSIAPHRSPRNIARLQSPVSPVAVRQDWLFAKTPPPGARIPPMTEFSSGPASHTPDAPPWNCALNSPSQTAPDNRT